MIWWAAFLIVICLGVPLALLLIWAAIKGIRWVVWQATRGILWVFILFVETITYRDVEGKAKWRWQK